MKAVILLIALVLLISAISIICTETKISSLGIALGLCVIAGYLFKEVTNEDNY